MGLIKVALFQVMFHDTNPRFTPKSKFLQLQLGAILLNVRQMGDRPA